MTTDLLLLDDDPMDVELMQIAFSRHFHLSMRAVHTIDDALLAIAESRPRVVLLDLKLRGASGFDLLAQLKVAPDRQSIPIVILSSSREPSDLCEAYRLGANGYVVKPVNFEEFADMVKRLGDFWLELNELP